MTLLDRLRALVENVPPGGSVTIPRDWLAGELQGAIVPATDADLTIAQVAARVGRALSTVRGWLERGELRGYRFRRREWRITPASLAEFLARERGATGRSTKRSEIGSWRELRKDAKVGPTTPGDQR